MLTRTLRRCIGRLLVGVLLVAQGMVAAYACPGLTRSGEQADAWPSRVAAASVATGGVAAEAQANAEHGVDCESMAGTDSSAPNLCHAHCQQDSQSDAGHLPLLVPAASGRLYGVEAAPAPGRQRLAGQAVSRPLAAAFPPHATLHCCLRV